MWTTENRQRQDLSSLRYPHDLADVGRPPVSPFIPSAKMRRWKMNGQHEVRDQWPNVYFVDWLPMANTIERFFCQNY